MLPWLRRDKRTRASKDPAEAVREPLLLRVEGFDVAIRSAVEAVRSAHEAEFAALRAEIAAVRAECDARAEEVSHLKTRVNSVQGLVNRKLGGGEPEAKPPAVPAAHFLGGPPQMLGGS